MAQADRKYTEDVTVWSADGASFLTRLKDATMTEECDTKENSALLDSAEYPVATKKRYRVEFDEAVEGAVTLRAGTSYTVVANDGTETWSGPALLMTKSSKISGDITRNYAFQYQGVPTIT